MRVLHVIDSGGIYGAEVMLLDLMGEQRALGLHPMLCSLGETGDGEKELERRAAGSSFPVFPLRLHPIFNFFGGLAIRDVADRQNTEVYHLHGYKECILLGFLPKACRKAPMVITLHGWASTRPLTKLRFYEWLHARSLRRCEAVVTVSRAISSHSRLKRLDRRLVEFIPNGITVPQPLPSRSGPVGDLDQAVAAFCRCGDPVIGGIGRLSEEKGFRDLIVALDSLAKRGTAFRAVIIGEGPERAGLAAAVSGLGLSSRVMMPGYLPEARRYLPLFDLLVLPSFTEGMPIVLLEAMAAGIPIVATAVGGVPELLQDGAGGLLVQPRRPPALAAAISQVLTDPQLVQRTTLRAREHVAEHFGSHRMAERYAEVYSRVVTEYSKGRGRRTRLSPAGTATHQAHRPNQENSPPPMPASDSKTEI